MFVDYYNILEIEYPSSPEEIKKSYHRLSNIWHPDKNLTEDTTQKMIDINEAYSILNNIEKKSHYDEEYIKFLRYVASHNPNKAHYNSSHCAKEDSDRASATQNASQTYHFHNQRVQDDINEAHKYAKELVEKFLEEFRKNSKLAAKGAWDGIWPYLIIIFILPIFFSLIRSCQ